MRCVLKEGFYGLIHLDNGAIHYVTLEIYNVGGNDPNIVCTYA
jgi:hypothetical protein